ncbi:hypothetical protein [Clostridium gasigenes]|uniref:hypothetical protein n=1 Tax=Clostridium gasigenes TaxID=94869 RepID=UPI001C0ADE2C|nr:hypothetical protein [Clostridium gasigenes]MBU3103069.1 hypothetical protein [Clostridium gasigenes]
MKIPFEFSSDDERNKWLLYHNLKKSYVDVGLSEIDAEKKTDEMILQNSKNLFGVHGLSWSLGKISLEFFCLYYMQDIYLPKEDNAAATGQCRQLSKSNYVKVILNTIIFTEFI